MRQELRIMADEGRIGFTAICFTHPQAKIEEYRKDSDRRKPGSGMLSDAMKALNRSKSDTLMVGDRPEDEQAAQNAGVAVMWAEECDECVDHDCVSLSRKNSSAPMNEMPSF